MEQDNENDNRQHPEFVNKSVKTAETAVVDDRTKRLLAATCACDAAKLKLLLADDAPDTCVVSNDILEVLLVEAIVLGKSYEVIKILIDHGARLDNIVDVGTTNARFAKFVRDRIVKLNLRHATVFYQVANPPELEEIAKAELDLVEILDLLVSRAQADVAFANVLEDEAIIKDCCRFNLYDPKSTFPLLRFFLVRGLDTKHYEHLLNTSLMQQNWKLAALLIEFGANCPGWHIQEYLGSFQRRYPGSVSILKEGIENRISRRNLICQHLFQSISPVCAQGTPSFDVTPLCAVISEYCFVL